MASQAISKFQKDGKTHVVTYDTPRTVANKVKLAIENHLGGVWIWFVSSDDFRGDCGPDPTTFADFPFPVDVTTEQDFPLLRTITRTYDIFSPRKETPFHKNGLLLRKITLFKKSCLLIFCIFMVAH